MSLRKRYKNFFQHILTPILIKKFFQRKSQEVPKLVFTFQHDATNGDNHDKEAVMSSDTDDTETSTALNNFPTLNVDQILDKADTLSVR